MTHADLPFVNALLNAVATVLLLAGYLFIRKGMKGPHIACMVAALAVSAVFLTGYVMYHGWLRNQLGVSGIKFTHDGGIRLVYYTILLTHVLGAIINLPMVILTVIPAARRRFDRHRRIARWTWPLWFYVSITGVLVYLMLYQWFPSDMLPLLRGAEG